MNVNFHATLRMAAGAKTIQVADTGSSALLAVLRAATQDKPQLASEIWDVSGTLYEHIHVMVNGRDARFLPDGLESYITPADHLDVFPAVGGGSSAP